MNKSVNKKIKTAIDVNSSYEKNPNNINKRKNTNDKRANFLTVAKFHIAKIFSIHKHTIFYVYEPT